jgi:hypothetical protein
MTGFILRGRDLAIQAGLPGIKYLSVSPSFEIQVTRPHDEK